MRSILASAGSARAAPEPATPSLPSPALEPRLVEQLLRIKGDLKLGLPVVLHDGTAPVLVALVEALTDQRYRAMSALGTAELALSRRRAEALGAGSPTRADTLRLPVPAGADRAWLAALAGHDGAGGAGGAGGAQPIADALPLMQPGTPLQAAAIALARTALAVPAVLTVPLATTAVPPGLMAMPLEALLEALEQIDAPARISSASLPTGVSAAGRVHVYRPDDGGPEHCAVEIGEPDFAQPVTVRLHSACFTGDVLGSVKCDCGPQLHAAMSAMAADGGVLLYLDQEGRGIGLANKMRAYALQDAGLDTVEANHWLGFEDDQRDFRVGAQLLHHMGIARVRLMTNNPAKVEILASQGIEVVERIPLQIGPTAQNAHYLATKAAKSGHLL